MSKEKINESLYTRTDGDSRRWLPREKYRSYHGIVSWTK